MSDYSWEWGPYALDADAQKRFVSHNHEDLLKICDVIHVNKNEKPRTSGCVPVHYEDGKLYVLKGESHTRVCGETGSKKSRTISRGCVAAAALCGHSSMVITDPKGEVYRDKKIRGILEERGYDVRCLDFRTMDKDGINLLSPAYDLLAQGNLQASDAYINRFVSMLTQDTASPNQDPFWNNNSSLIIASIIRLLRNALIQENDQERFHLGSVLTFLRHDKETLEGLFAPLAQDAAVRDPFREYFNYLQSSADRTYSSLIWTAQSLLSSMTASDALLRMLCVDTFHPKDMYTRKLAVFIIIPDETKAYDQVSGFICNIIYEILISEYASKYEGRRRRPSHNVCFILDEVATLKLHDINSKVAAGRSRCISFHFLYQSEKQMQQQYPEYGSVAANCRNYIFLGSSDYEELCHVSQSVGQSNLSPEGPVPLVSVDDLRRMKKQTTYKDALVVVGEYVLCARLADYDVYPFLKPLRISEETTNRLPQQIFIYTPEEIVADYHAAKFQLPGGKRREASAGDIERLVEAFDNWGED